MVTWDELRLVRRLWDLKTRFEQGADWDRVLRDAAAEFEAAGVVADLHVGRTDLTPRERVEWYAGQLVSVAQHDGFGLGTWCNCLDKFVPNIT